MKKIFILAILVSLGGCKYFDPTVPWFDKVQGNTTLDPAMPPDARQGWEDGCHSGYAVYGNTFYKSFYGFKRDTTKVGNYLYENNWYDGYHYCRQSVNTMINDGVI